MEIENYGINLFEIFTLIFFRERFYLIRSWCLKPCRSPEILERRYNVIEFFLDTNQHELMRTLRDYIKPIVNIPVRKFRNSV